MVIETRKQQVPLTNFRIRKGIADIGIVGLAVMGQNLCLNLNDHGYIVAAYNRTLKKVDDFMANEAKNTNIVGAFSIQDFVNSLKRPRKVMLLIKAGNPVESMIDQLIPYLEPGDIIIDAGNSEHKESTERTASLKEMGILFVGSGVCSGEEGARWGPSMTPGGNPEAWPHIKDILQAVAAKVDGQPCCDWVGESGSGHFVKSIHNGLEYGDMQLICEVYHIMKDVIGLDHQKMSDIFAEWNKTELDSFLAEITSNILKYQDLDGKYLVEKIRDSAGQKGTGKWTAISALEYGIPLTVIMEAVTSRCVSSFKDERVVASKELHGPSETNFQGDVDEFVNDLKKALYASKIVSYAQGFMLMREGAKIYNWNLNYSGIAHMWRGGCVIRSTFLGKIKNAFDNDPTLTNLLLDDFFKDAMKECQASWRKVIATAVLSGIPTPCFSTALAFYDAYRCEQLPANLIQAQRDYFGAHTYELLSTPGKHIHTNWSGNGGRVSASIYQV